ncbi:MAG: flagellar hook-basal body complex protein FliE [Pseudorhodobacter sp.]
MEITSSLASQSYLKARKAAAAEPQTQGMDFSKLATSFAETLARGEQTAKAAMIGNADPNALVQALAATETAVETVVMVRDKVVEAYQEILRMPV